MATLQAIRNRAVLLTVIIGLALFAFIIGDFLNSGSTLFQQSQEKIAVIGDSKLDYRDYEARIQEMESVYKIQTGQTSIDDVVAGQIRESVFESIVRERLLDEQAALLGVSVSSKELFDMLNGPSVHPTVQQLPIFANPETGRFDRAVMMQFLQTIQQDDLSMFPADAQAQIKELKAYWLFWENNLKYQRMDEKINAILEKAVQANSLDAQMAFTERNTTYSFEYAFQPYSTLPDSLFKVSSSDLKKRYSQEQNRFKQQPHRSAKYVLVTVNPSDEDFRKVEDQINQLRSDIETADNIFAFAKANTDDTYPEVFVSNTLFDPSLTAFLNAASVGDYLEPVFEAGVYRTGKVVDQTTAPDSVRARQIVLPVDGQSKADSLLKVLQSGADFDALAAEHSLNKGNSDMGWFRELDAQQMGADFLEKSFSTPLNGIFIHASQYGISLVQITNRTAPVAKSKAAIIALKVLPSSETYSKHYNDLNRILAENQTADAFFKAAEASNYSVQSAPFLRSTDQTLAEIPQMRQAIRFIFNSNLGDLSDILENNNNQFLIAGVTDVQEGDFQSLEAVSSTLTRELINEQKAEKLAAEMKNQSTQSIPEVAQALNARYDTLRFVNEAMRRISPLGEEPALIAAVSQTEVNAVGPIVKGKNGVYLFRVLSKEQGQQELNIASEKESWNQNQMYRLVYQNYDAVRKAANVEDNRIRFY